MSTSQAGFFTGEGTGAITGDITLHGFDELENILYNLAGNAGLDILKKTWRQSLEPMRQNAINKAPSLTGELKSNIRIRINRRSGYPVSYQIYVRRGRRQTKAEKETGLRSGGKSRGGWYGHFLEFGVKPHWMPKEYKPSMRSKRFKRLMGIEGNGASGISGMVQSETEKRKVMVFTAGGKKITVSHVRHPGFGARPFMRPAFDETRERTINSFGHNLVYAIQNYFRGNPVGMGMSETLSAGVM